MSSEKAQKTQYVLDTNVLLHDASVLDTLADQSVILPISILEELDHFKRDTTDRGVNARIASVQIEKLFKGFPGLAADQLAVGVRTEAGGMVSFQACVQEDLKDLPTEFMNSKGDDNLLAIAKKAQKRYIGQKIVIMSKDRNLRLRASLLGLDVQDFPIFDVIPTSRWTPDLNTTPSVSSTAMTTYCYSTKMNKLFIAKGALQYCEVTESPEAPSHALPASVNLAQKCAINALLDPEITSVAIIGPCKSGKTLITLKALLNFAHVLSLSRDVSWQTAAYFTKPTAYLGLTDSTEFIRRAYDDLIHAYWSTNDLELHKQFSSYIEFGELPIHFGRRIAQRLLIIDDAQNLTTSELKSIIESLGEKSKLVLLGDLDRIDNPYVSRESCGLAAYLTQHACTPAQAIIALPVIN